VFHVEPPEASGEPFHVEPRAVLEQGLAELGLSTDPGQLDRWEKLALLLDRWSERINLTGHRGALAIAERLLLEAAALSQVLPAAETIADLGSGAGIPGLPLAICRPECLVRLVESRERRHHFQRAAIRDLGLDNVVALLGRAERLEVHPSQGVIAQAMAQPEQALNWMRPWMTANGWLALATVPGGADQLRHPDLTQGRALRYAAPRGPERSVWIARLRHPDPAR
jgi:16S rRNA (guanine527-N7)-methyltransferase